MPFQPLVVSKDPARREQKCGPAHRFVLSGEIKSFIGPAHGKQNRCKADPKAAKALTQLSERLTWRDFEDSALRLQLADLGDHRIRERGISRTEANDQSIRIFAP